MKITNDGKLQKGKNQKNKSRNKVTPVTNSNSDRHIYKN